MPSMSALRRASALLILATDRVEANLRRAQDYADSHGLKLRPHTLEWQRFPMSNSDDIFRRYV